MGKVKVGPEPGHLYAYGKQAEELKKLPFGPNPEEEEIAPPTKIYEILDDAESDLITIDGSLSAAGHLAEIHKLDGELKGDIKEAIDHIREAAAVTGVAAKRFKEKFLPEKE